MNPINYKLLQQDDIFVSYIFGND